MTVKLVGSTSGSVSLQAPASTSGGAHRVLTLPDVNGTIATTTTAGKILQVVSATTTTNVSSSSTSHVDTGLSCSITTTSASNKVYVSVCQSMMVRSSANTASARLAWDLVRGSTVISDGEKNIAIYATPYAPFNYSSQMASFVFLDSPGSAATHTYKTTALVHEGNWKAQDNSTPSHIVLMEVAA
tara:strand:- start:385 stop:942 length:558 start_codon:yes stop_codon:yes gene_type:complete